MKNRIGIDLETGVILHEVGEETRSFTLDTPEGFGLISDVWLRSGWQNKHVYTFTWMGRPIIQLPEDMLRIQEVVAALRPDVIVETGIAHGGSIVFYAGLCRLLGRGRVIGVDIDIRSHNRSALERHDLFDLITLIEGDAASGEVVQQVRNCVSPGETVFVVLDSNHSKTHVLNELRAYAPLVTPGSYILVADGITRRLAGLARYQDERPTAAWKWDNPLAAISEFIDQNPDFELCSPRFAFNESPLTEPITYMPGGWIRRK